MRPAIEAGLMAYWKPQVHMRSVLILSKATFCLSISWSRAPIIGKPVPEKETSSAYSSFSAFFPKPSLIVNRRYSRARIQTSAGRADENSWVAGRCVPGIISMRMHDAIPDAISIAYPHEREPVRV
jgi:hypothetical protein